LTLRDPELSKRWEPGASLPEERIKALYEAKMRGIRTWVSFEPVLYTEDVFELIDATASFVDVYKVGTLNHAEKLPSQFRLLLPDIDWAAFGNQVSKKLDATGAEYYIKKDLLDYMAGSRK